MKKKLQVSIILALVLVLVLSTISAAQYAGLEWGTAYQVVNIGDGAAEISIEYYNEAGQLNTEATKVLASIPSLGSQLVVQKKDDPKLGQGSFSAVISSSAPVAAIANQQLYKPGSTNPQPPFSSYSASDKGSTSVYLPAVMYNYYNFYTEMFIMNVGAGDATVDITYYPGTVNGVVIGTAGQTQRITVASNASKKVSQQAMSNLGAPAGSGNDTGRFFGSAYLKSDKDIVVVVNQHNPVQKKLLTYNGFTAGSTSVALPVHMRTFYEYYSALTILNTSSTQKACVNITYTPSTDQPQKVVAGSPVAIVANHTIDPLKSLMRFDGFTASDDQSDLDDNAPVSYTQFYGSVLVESVADAGKGCQTAAPIVAFMNVESDRNKNSQAGAYNGVPSAQASETIIAPIIIADYFGYYTNLTIQNTTANSGSCTVTYTSGPDSANPNFSKSYSHPLTPYGSFTVYEGRKGTLRGDINTDAAWRTAKGSAFLGAAKITCPAGLKVVGFTNEERDIWGIDSMYTFNTINK